MAQRAAPAGPLLHICSASAWREAQSSENQHYRNASLDTEGFIHCSTPEQVLMPANALYVGQDDLVLLVIDDAKVPSAIIFEDCYESGHAFPHIYGELPVEAVVDVVPFPCESDGSFQLPETFTSPRVHGKSAGRN